MAHSRKSRKISPVIFVFCEGKSEKAYVDFLRTHYRVPMQIVAKVLDTGISQRSIDSHIKNSGYAETDKVFLFYDGDRKDILEKLHSIHDVRIMLSYPCVELWYTLHFTEYSRYTNSAEMERILRKFSPGYEKGELQESLRFRLMENWRKAAERAKKLSENRNPSTTAYQLQEYMEEKKRK